MRELLAGSLVTCFITSDAMLKSSPLTRHCIDHLLNYDGRFERDTMFISVLFNQLQRHAAVQKAALIRTMHEKTLAKLGKLSTETAFRDQLVWASENPNTVKAKRLNAHLLRLLSLVGGTVPFSPASIDATKTQRNALPLRHRTALCDRRSARIRRSAAAESHRSERQSTGKAPRLPTTTPDFMARRFHIYSLN